MELNHHDEIRLMKQVCLSLGQVHIMLRLCFMIIALEIGGHVCQFRHLTIIEDGVGFEPTMVFRHWMRLFASATCAHCSVWVLSSPYGSFLSQLSFVKKNGFEPLTLSLCCFWVAVKNLIRFPSFCSRALPTELLLQRHGKWDSNPSCSTFTRSVAGRFTN